MLHRAGSSMHENKYLSNEQAWACLKTQIRARACLSIEKILHDRAFVRAFDQKCTIFAKILSIFKGCIASSMKTSSIERARAFSKMKIRASSMLNHQKLASDGHFSGSSMLGCNTTKVLASFGRFLPLKKHHHQVIDCVWQLTR